MKLLDNGQVLFLTRSKRVHLGEGVSRAEFGRVVVDGDQIELRGPGQKVFASSFLVHLTVMPMPRRNVSARFPFIAQRMDCTRSRFHFRYLGIGGISDMKSI